MAAMTIESSAKANHLPAAGWFKRDSGPAKEFRKALPDTRSLNLNQARVVYLQRLQHCRSLGLDTHPAESVYHQVGSALLRCDSRAALDSLRQAIDLLPA